MTDATLRSREDERAFHEACFEFAARRARMATCTRARCGAVIVLAGGEGIIGQGFNAPPLGDEANRKCDGVYDLTSKPKSDKTCCIHAEWNAIIDGLSSNSENLIGSTLYFMRVDENGEFTDAGEPYCTVCSRLALQTGISFFALWNDGPQIIPMGEYNDASYAYHRKTSDSADEAK